MKNAEIAELFEDLASSRIIPIIAMAVVMGILLIIFEVSFASMIFSGELSPLASRAAGLTLAGAFLICLIGSVSSSFKGVIPLPQDAPTAVLSMMAVSMAAAMGPQAPPEVKYMTVTAAIAMSAMFAGLCYLLVGRFRLANLLRFMPYPVVGGFLAGTGWLLVSGSLGVMCDVSLSMGNLTRLMRPDIILRWIPGVVFGAAVFFVLLKKSQVLILPGSLVVGTIVFYLVLTFAGISVQEAKSAGFLISGVPSQGLWPAFSLSDMSLINWQIVLSQLPAIFSVALVSIVGMLLNMSGIEVGARSEMDINDEFMVFGTGNMVAGACGSVPGYPSIALSLLTHKAGADSRLTGIICALIVGLVLFFGGDLLGYFPKCLLGGLVLLLGLFLIYDWIISTRNRLPLIDWLIVFFIFLVTGLFGFMEGVAAGLVATIIFFVFRFSRVPVIKQTFTGTQRTSLKARSVPHRHILRAQADKICGYELTGYLFFGSAFSLLDSLKTTLMNEPAPGFMLLDFKQVTGFDISAVNNFQRVALSAQAGGCSLAVTGAPQRFVAAIQKNFPEDVRGNLSFFKTLNDGLEWCEDCLIRDMETALSKESDLKDSIFERSVEDVMKQLENQETVEKLAHELTDWLAPRDHSPGSIIVEKGQTIDGFHLITWGRAIAYDRVTKQRLGSLEQGCVIAGPAAFSPDHACPVTIMADSACKTAFLSSKARKRLEKENPELAIALYGYLIQSDTGR